MPGSRRNYLSRLGCPSEFENSPQFGCTLPIPLKDFVELRVECDPATFVPRCRYRPTSGDLIFPLHNFTLGVGDVCGKCEDEVLGYSLLHCQACGGVRVVASDQRVNLQTGNTGQLPDATAHLACQSLCQNKIRVQIRGGSFLGSFSQSQQVDNVDWRKRRIGSIGRPQAIDRPDKVEAQIVLLDRRRKQQVDNRLRLVRVDEIDDPAFQLIAFFHEKDLAAVERCSADDDRVRGRPYDAQVGLTLQTYGRTGQVKL